MAPTLTDAYDVHDISVSPAADAGAVAACAARLREALREGPGLLVARACIDARAHDRAGMVRAMTALADAIGECLPQSKDIRELVGHVEQHDPAIHGRNGYRGYRNNREQRLHTDTPTPLVEVDFMILFCVEQAAAGGASRVCPSARIIGRLSPPSVETLSSSLPFLCCDEYVEEWRGGGEGAAPLIARDADGNPTLVFSKIMRTNIEHSLRARGESTSDGRIPEALEELWDITGDEGVIERVRLEAGDMMVMANRRFFHARDAFDDGAGGKRLLLRFWIRDRSIRGA